MLDNETSTRLSILRFPLIVAVVFIHNYDLTVKFASENVGSNGGHWLTDFFRNFISQGVARAAVPLFFLMSGYLFFFGVKWNMRCYIVKIKSRFWTLLVPFLFWNFATLVALALVQAIPLTRNYLSGTKAEIASYGFYGYFDAIFGIEGMPVSYQFWFIRDLMILVLFAPLINFLVSRFLMVSLGLLGLSWFFDIFPITVPSSDAVFFFVIGSAVAISKRNLFRLDAHSNKVYLTYLFSLFVDMFLIGSSLGPYFHRFGIFFGVLSFLCISRVILNYVNFSQSLLALSKVSFFVFAAHEPMLTIVKKVTFQLIHPISEVTFLALYFLIPSILIVLLVKVYGIFSMRFPSIMNVIVGGR